MIVVTGTATAVEQPMRIYRRRVGGRETERTFEGPRAAVEAMEQSLWSEGATDVVIDQSPGSAKARITARFALPQDGQQPGAVIEETLTISFADHAIKLHRHPHFIGIASENIGDLEKEIEKDTPTVPTDATELEYYNLRRRGVEDYRAAFPVVVYSRTVPPNFPGRIDPLTIGAIYTAAQVASAVSAPILFTIPNANVGSVAGADYIVGYRYTAQIDYLANGGWQIVENYEWGQWETLLYS